MTVTNQLARKLKGCVEELSNFTYLVLAAVALFRSVSVRFIICLFQRKVYV